MALSNSELAKVNGYKSLKDLALKTGKPYTTIKNWRREMIEELIRQNKREIPEIFKGTREALDKLTVTTKRN